MIISEGLQGYNSDNRQADYQKDRAVLQKKGREVTSKVLIYMCALYKDVYGIPVTRVSDMMGGVVNLIL